MKTKEPIGMAALLALLGLTTVAVQAAPMGTAFTYHGHLSDGTNPATGLYDFRWQLFDAVTDGIQLGPTMTNSVGVTNGLFTSTLDFGPGIFTGEARWLEMGVRANGSATNFTTLTPRLGLAPAPYALHAASASNVLGMVSDAQLSPNVARLDTSPNFVGTVGAADFAGNGAGVSNVNATAFQGLGPSAFWQLGGNGGTTPGTHFLGTVDGQALELKVNNQRVLRLEPSLGVAVSGTPNVIAGAPVNSVYPFGHTEVVGATIAGGGAADYNGLSGPNTVGADFGTIGGGVHNKINHFSTAATIAGGWENAVETTADGAAIGGGWQNTNHSYYATIAGGIWNLIDGTANSATIGGGEANTVSE